MTASTNSDAPISGTPEWTAKREEELKRLAARSRYRRTARESPKLHDLRAELNRIYIAELTATGAEAEKLAQRVFDLQQAIRREQENASPTPPPYSSTARTAASSRVPGEDDE